MHPVVRSIAAAALAVVSLSCADHSLGLKRGTRLAKLPIAPVFATNADGGPRIEVERIKGILRRDNSTDSSVAEALVVGDSAVLEFGGVTVAGEETGYSLEVKAYDANGVLVFKGHQQVTLKPGENNPASPTLEYTAPDATVAEIFIASGGTGVASIDLQWAGAAPTNSTCLNRVPDAAAIVEKQLIINGLTAAEQPITDVRVGWTSRDESVATVDDNGLVRARCSNRSTYVVARTFLDIADSVLVNVTAPPFTLLMDPETANVPRGSTRQMTAINVDENGNSTAVTAVTWHSSDVERATVSPSGLVTGIQNGRVVITASSGDRSTVGIIQVVRPLASRVEITPASDNVSQGQRRVFTAQAFDVDNERILDASGFGWSSTNPSIVSVTSAGSVLGVAQGTAGVIVSLDGRADTATVVVGPPATTGRVSATVIDASTQNPLAGAVATTSAGAPTADNAGRFTSPELPPNGQTVTVSRAGYVSFSYFNLPIQVGNTVELGDLPMAPSGAGGAGTLTGTVVNALNDAAVSGATVRLYAGINSNGSHPSCTTTCDAFVAQATTAADGSFTITGVAPGTYTYTVTAAGYTSNRRVAVSVTAVTRDSRIPLSPALTGTDIRIVLSWGNCSDPDVPCDLDSHLTGPASAPDTGRFHVAYFNDIYQSESTVVAALDNDATNGLGPETITLRQQAAGIYKYYIHNFSDGFDTTGTRLSATSQAKVEVYQGATLVATFFPPAGQAGTVWAVFQVEGTAITTVNQMLKIQDFTEVPGDFMRIGVSEEQRLLDALRRHQARVKRR
jgi:hypothetical protein